MMHAKCMDGWKENSWNGWTQPVLLYLHYMYITFHLFKGNTDYPSKFPTFAWNGCSRGPVPYSMWACSSTYRWQPLYHHPPCHLAAQLSLPLSLSESLVENIIPFILAVRLSPAFPLYPEIYKRDTDTDHKSCKVILRTLSGLPCMYVQHRTILSRHSVIK